MRKLSVIASLVAMTLGGISNAQVLANTSFNTGEGYTPVALVNQQSWLTDTSPFNVTASVAHTGNQSVTLDSSIVSTAWAWKTFNAPTYIASGLVVTSVWVRYNDTTPADRTDNSAWGLMAWDNDGFDQLGTLVLDARGGVTIRAGFNDTPVRNTSMAHSSGNWYNLVLVNDIANRKVKGYFNGQDVAGVLNSSSTYVPLNLSDVDLTCLAFGADAANFGVTPGGGFDTGFWDDYSVYQTPVGTVSGTVLLNDWVVSRAGVPLTVNIIDGNGSVVESKSTTLDANGNYSVAVSSRGTFTVGLKASHWLQSNVGSYNIQSTGLLYVNGTLDNADIDGDNEVGPGDFGLLSSAYGAVNGDTNWDPNADLDGDGEVGPGDFGILSTNYGMTGD